MGVSFEARILFDGAVVLHVPTTLPACANHRFIGMCAGIPIDLALSPLGRERNGALILTRPVAVSSIQGQRLMIGTLTSHATPMAP